MKTTILVLTFAGFLFTAISACAASVEERAADLKKAINDEIASKPDLANANGQRGGYDPRMVAAAVEQITSQLDNPNMGGNVDSQLNQMLASFTSDAVQKARQDLLEAIHLRQKEKADAAANQMKELLKHVSEEINKAKKPEDLDGLLVELQKFQGDRYGSYGGENQALSQQISGAFEFTKLWQNYLSHIATGQGQLATSDLQSLSQNNYGVGLIPRSQILALLASSTSSPRNAGQTPPAISAAEKIVKGIKTLDEMEPALQQLNSMSDVQSQMERTNLASLVQTYEALKAGLPATINQNLLANYDGHGVSQEVFSKLLLFALHHDLASYQGSPAGQDEKPQQFVDKVVADAVRREDWLLLKKALSAQAYLNRNSTFNAPVASNGVDDLLTALKQDEAAQYALAVVTYQRALTTSDTNIPPKFIGDKLAAIKKNHPKEYEDGMQMVLSPPVPRYSTYPGMYPGMPYRPGMPGYPGYPMTQPNPGLSIPGAATNQVTAPAPPQAPASTNPPPAAPALPTTNAPPAK